MKRLKGHFVVMVLIAEGEWLEKSQGEWSTTD